MIEHKCVRCERVFKNKYNLQSHLHKKIPCDRVLRCDRCYYMASTIYHLNQHKNRKKKCNIINIQESEKDKEILKLKLQIAEIKYQQLQLLI